MKKNYDCKEILFDIIRQVMTLEVNTNDLKRTWDELIQMLIDWHSTAPYESIIVSVYYSFSVAKSVCDLIFILIQIDYIRNPRSNNCR